GRVCSGEEPLRLTQKEIVAEEKYYNPLEDSDSGGGGGRNTLIMVALVLAFLIGSFFIKTPKPAEPAQPQTSAAPQSTQSAPSGIAAVTKPAPPQHVEVASKQAASEREIVIENDLYKITFTNRGAQVKSWILKKFDDDHGKPLELVHPTAAPQYGYPLSLYSYDGDLNKNLASGLYVTASDSAMQAPAEITFEYADGEVA